MTSSLPRAAALAAALSVAAPVACAAQSPVAPPARAAGLAPEPHRRGLVAGETPECPPVPARPETDPARCGNGRVDSSWQLISAPCVPGRCCASGWVPQPLETCDGADLGGATCGSKGYLGGVLRCTTACELDASGCEASGPGARTARLPGLAVAGAALARDADTLAIASVEGGALRFRTVSARTLAPLGPARDSAPACAPRAPPPVDRALLVPFRDGFLAAIGCGVGTTLLRVPRAGPIEAPRDARAGLPLFLARGAPGVLLGIEPHVSGYPLELVRLDTEGHPQWEPVRAVVAARPTFGNLAAAAWLDGEWVAVSASSATQEARVPRSELFAARVTEDGAVREARALGTGGRGLALASDGRRALAVFTTWSGVFAVDVATRGPGPVLQLAAQPEPDRLERVLAAELSGDVLTAWVDAARPPPGGAGAPVRSVYRVRATLGGTVEPAVRVLAGPGLVPAAALAEGGGAFLLASDGEGGATLTAVR